MDTSVTFRSANVLQTPILKHRWSWLDSMWWGGGTSLTSLHSLAPWLWFSTFCPQETTHDHQRKQENNDDDDDDITSSPWPRDPDQVKWLDNGWMFASCAKHTSVNHLLCDSVLQVALFLPLMCPFQVKIIFVMYSRTKYSWPISRLCKKNTTYRENTLYDHIHLVNFDKLEISVYNSKNVFKITCTQHCGTENRPKVPPLQMNGYIFYPGRILIRYVAKVLIFQKPS